ncbi:DNA mismatch repair protein MutS [Parasporobacterium paucivorans]|uniref:DNA mismatch repair protein MutS n=1 Tax=Parasporobacterium paucivorans DSM 15970 TaxID=1122934 RepID=A0A1M6A1W6_9FIRM|nr:DNA mismatch repair protein MutS [Parasporobacterium paucivorans]SHI30504.1 DNA mismatch repair protein MutS [Parasporobacterium paucivorans DSM 15970]
MAKLSPMMEQYLNSKKQYSDCILMYRLGDFYEMFFEDAVTAARELEITLTGKDCGMEERAPMCGVPYHALEVYLNKLVSKGYKVAIGEQMEDPKNAKGIVRREVTRVVTAGTNFNTEALDETKNNYLMSIIYLDGLFGISTADITTGDYYVTEVDSIRKLTDEISKFMPSEIICNNAFYVSGYDIETLNSRLNISISPLDAWYFDDILCRRTLMEQFKVMDLSGLGLGDYPLGVIAAGSLLQYLKETQKTSLGNLTVITPYSTEKYMVIDTSTRRNLELTETLREKQKKGSLLGVLDRTRTAMGARMLRNFITQPLIDKNEILARQGAIEEFNNFLMDRDEVREYLNPIYDLERLVAKISYRSANPRDLAAFKNSMEMIPFIKSILLNFKNSLISGVVDKMDTLEDITSLIADAIIDDPPVSIKEGGFIREGYNEEIDRLRLAKTEGKKWLAQLEARERERSGIKSLKVKYNKVFGYCIEITNTYKDNVPQDYTRKQTLVNAERYITPELKELEETILGAQDKLFSIEYDLYNDIRDKISSQVLRILSTAKAIAEIDVYSSLAYVAERNGYVRPQINEKGLIDIKEGRHPVVEKMISNELFVSNDTFLDNGKNRISIITGPNMAGKSTYMRQAALIVLMAQIGSFVPAASANIGICDRIFTRVGASDDLASGQSTFMVEMTEVANILRNATPKSLLILDEIGRGTSTFDGLSIAWAVIEYIANPKILGAKTLFATHYHELTELEGMLESVNNYCIAVKEKGDDIIFLRKIVKGGADRSYGIQVAKLAGVPEAVIHRAKEIAVELGNADIAIKASGHSKDFDLHTMENEQMTLFDVVKDDDIIDELKGIDIGNLTPVEALNTLYKLQNKVKNRWKS